MIKLSVTQEEITKTHDWAFNDIIANFAYGELLDMIQQKEWELLQGELASIRETYPVYEVEHNLNPLAVFSDLFTLVGKPARVLAKEYEENVWKIHKDSVTQGIYYENRTEGVPHSQELKNYTDTLVPILRPANKTQVVSSIIVFSMKDALAL